MARCAWATTENSSRYHDEEWGVPSFDDRHLFEMIVLEGAQAGLSWETILKKREGYREAFENFDIQRIAKFNARRIEKLLNNPEIVRNRLKITSTIDNAKAAIRLIDDEGSLHEYLWSFVDGKPMQNRWKQMADLPAKTQQSEAMSKALKKRGFRFVGPTIMYAFMQATGMVNDHLTSCPRHKACAT